MIIPWIYTAALLPKSSASTVITYLRDCSASREDRYDELHFTDGKGEMESASSVVIQPTMSHNDADCSINKALLAS